MSPRPRHASPALAPSRRRVGSAPGALAAAAVALTALASAAPAVAYFEDVQLGSRPIAMGLSAMADVSDVSAYHWNPAGLAALGGTQAMAYWGNPQGVQDLSTGALAAGGRWRDTGFAVAWHRLGIADVYAEDQLAIAAGRRVATLAGGHALDAGATFKWGRVGFQPFTDRATGVTEDFGGLAKGSLDVGVVWRTPWAVDVGWVSRDLLEPRYELVLGSGGERQPWRQELGAAWRWNRESTLTATWREIGPAGDATLDLGVEIWFYEVFAIRSGLANTSAIVGAQESPNDLQFAGGIGVKSPQWELDASATTNRDLGASYRVSILVPFGGGAK